MNVQIFVGLFLVLLTMTGVPVANAKQKSLKIIIPSKIRYVHHHHTHVVLMKDKKSHKDRPPNAKFHHLHYYDDGVASGRKNKAVSHHYYIPFLPPPADDETEDESVAKYTIAHPKNNRIFPKSNYISTRQLPPVYEQPFSAFPRKFGFYNKKTKEAYSPSKNVIEFYENDPYFPVLASPERDHLAAGSTNVAYEYKEELLPHFTGEADFDSGQLFYPEKSVYGSTDSFSHVY